MTTARTLDNRGEQHLIDDNEFLRARIEALQRAIAKHESFKTEMRHRLNDLGLLLMQIGDDGCGCLTDSGVRFHQRTTTRVEQAKKLIHAMASKMDLDDAVNDLNAHIREYKDRNKCEKVGGGE